MPVQPGAPGQPGGAREGGTQPGGHPGWGPPPGAPAAWIEPPRPGIVPLRPLGVWEIFEGAFRAIRANPKVMLGTSAVVFGSVAVLTLVLGLAFSSALAGAINSVNGQELFRSTDLVGVDPLSVVISFVATSALTGLLVVSVSSSVIGRRIGAGELWQRVRGRVLALVGLSLLINIALLAAVLVGAVPGVLVLALGGDAVLGGVVLAVGILLGVLAAVWLYTTWSFATVALLLEDRRVLPALRRSRELLRGTWWRVFGVLLLTQVLVGIATSILLTPGVVLTLVVDVVVGSSAGGVLGLFVTLLFQTVAYVLSYPFLAGVVALLYTDVRMRREGLDVELARAAGGATP